MTDSGNDIDFVDLAADLLTYYSFDLAGQTVGQLIEAWVQLHPPIWLRAAVVEALYQGRYKAVSVGHILTIWSRRGQPICHFNLEFERMVCEPITVVTQAVPVVSSLQAVKDSEHQILPQALDIQQYSEDVVPRESITPHFEKAERFMHTEKVTEEEGLNPPINMLSVDTLPNGDVSSKKNTTIPQTVGAFEFKLRFPSRDLAETRLNLSGTYPDQPIHKFTPVTESSMFYTRLQGMASNDQALATFAQHDVSVDESPQPDTHHARSHSKESEEVVSNSSHLDNVQLPPQPDLEAIAAALHEESLHLGPSPSE